MNTKVELTGSYYHDIVIATTNRDKFSTVAGLFRLILGDEYGYLGLEGSDSMAEPTEEGGVLVRAAKKAFYYRSVMEESIIEEDRRPTLAVVGVDDAFRVGKDKQIIVDSTEFTEDLISGNRYEQGTTIYIVRGFCVLDINAEAYYAFTTEVPYTYIGARRNVVYREHRYPLKYLLALTSTGSKIEDIDSVDHAKYQLMFAYRQLKHLKPFLQSLKSEIVPPLQ